jgi:hypothetical protein
MEIKPAFFVICGARSRFRQGRRAVRTVSPDYIRFSPLSKCGELPDHAPPEQIATGHAGRYNGCRVGPIAVVGLDPRSNHGS